MSPAANELTAMEKIQPKNMKSLMKFHPLNGLEFLFKG
jgi:hypothetical protein